ncbi:methyl-accepting chemotaxis protein [Pelagimonas varians]|uniref:Methyl-accepting chemotaxis protein I n=1 Tax=Pelagimonas varians TaxID=696760 RepID=A0A238K682_9RHOB|nr:methyl-accepting chemotaxis protein [Pelagimonas varians]PYG30441.1 methyl-accepting chemotaxis protein [Pelagimonas varians]SMX37612.1 Methyl-accepting chemotaxis protein I [Pelagimonas varians]
MLTSGVKNVSDTQDFKLQIYASLALSPWPMLVALYVNPAMPWILLGAASLAITVLTFISRRLPQGIGPYVISFALVAHCVLLTVSFIGHPWQTDSHMLYFVAIAVSSTLNNARVLFFTAAIIAVHHLAFTLLIPSLVYPDGTTLSNVGRTIMHAAIVVMETSVLLVSILQKKAIDAEALSQRQEALKQAEIAKDAEMLAQSSQEQSDRIVSVLTENLALLADGDLTCEITDDFPPSHAKLRDDFNRTIETLNQTMERIFEVATGIRNGSANVARASDNLSTRTESQAATLEEAAAALEELTNSVGSAAQSTQNVESSIFEAKQGAENSGHVVQNAVEAMNEIETSASHISQIIGVIDNIAFQTNLLALNAGVEAARAGEAGNGFAVVASEVRALAQRSAESAKEIKVLIGNSSEQVDRGVELVGRAGKALTEIVAQVSEISRQVSAITQGTLQQSAALAEINTGVTQLDQVTQENAAMVHESTSASHKLDADARSLADMVAQFTIQQPQRREIA